MRMTVTIARQLGCGASELGQALAETLGVRCIDREILSETARKLACEESHVENCEEMAPTFWEKLLVGLNFGPPEALYTPADTVSRPSLEAIFHAETDVMKTRAVQEDCVVVGRAAAHVLPPQPGLINIFLYAPVEFRIPRVMGNFGATTPEAARALITRSDTQRQKLVISLTGRDVADANNYHLCLDTSSLHFTDIPDLLADFVRRRTASVAALAA